MKLCSAFSSLLAASPTLSITARGSSQSQASALSLTNREQEEVARISKEFRKQSSLFFDIVSGIKVHGCAPHLAQLLLRVDYNKYFSNTKLSTAAKLQGFP